MRISYEHYCTPIIKVCQHIFLWYSIGNMTPEFEILVRVTRRVIEAINQRLEAIQEIADNLKTTADHAEHREREARQRDRETVAEQVRLAYATERKRSAEHKQNLCVQWVIGSGTWIAVFAASVYACIAAYQLCAMRQQVRISQQTLVATERAYVNVQDVKVTSFKIGEIPEAQAFYKNAGLTPATYLLAQPASFIRGQTNGKPPEPQTRQLECGTTIAMGAVLPAGVTRPVKSNVMTLGDDPESLKFASVPLLKDDFKAVQNYQKTWYVVVYVSYDDGFGYFRQTAEPFEYDPATKSFNAAKFGWRQLDCEYKQGNQKSTEKNQERKPN